MSAPDSRTRRIAGGLFVGDDLSLRRFIVTAQVVVGPDQGLEATRDDGALRIGSGSTCHLVLTDDTVSRHHCELVRDDHGYLLRDLGSTNGTYVGRIRVRECYIEPGTEIRVGQTEISFGATDHTEPIRFQPRRSFGRLRSRSQSMSAIYSLLERVAPTELTCMILGETGTGKEVVAREIHAASRRADHPFVIVDCATLHEQLVESELFGHERGAFTGADRTRDGAFREGHGGTVFLDEIGELPLSQQARLLRVLETGEVRRVGSTKPESVDVRILAATHRDLPQMVEHGEFRRDLFHRLNIVEIRLPPLRERLEDLPDLTAALLGELVPNPAAIQLSQHAWQILSSRTWPGNVRELRNAIRRAVALGEGLSLAENELARASAEIQPSVADFQVGVPLRVGETLVDARAFWLEFLEREYLRQTLELSRHDYDEAAGAIGIHRKSLYRLLRRHGIDYGEP